MRKVIDVPGDLLERIVNYWHDNRHKSFKAAMLELCDLALKSQGY